MDNYNSCSSSGSASYYYYYYFCGQWRREFKEKGDLCLDHSHSLICSFVRVSVLVAHFS